MDRGEVTHTLVANGVGLLLEDARRGVRLIIAHLASRALRELPAAQGNG